MSEYLEKIIYNLNAIETEEADVLAEVTKMGYEPEPKSVSNGMTFRHNLKSSDDVSFALTYLSMSVAERLRKHNLCCNTVAVTIRFTDQTTINRQNPLEHSTCLFDEISKNALEIVNSNLSPNTEIYSITVHAEKLSRGKECVFQQQLFPEPWEVKYEKRYSLEATIDAIRSRYFDRLRNKQLSYIKIDKK